MPRTIDITPTWPQALKMCRMLIENGNPAGQQTAWEEIERMAELAQEYTDMLKKAHDAVKGDDHDPA